MFETGTFKDIKVWSSQWLKRRKPDVIRTKMTMLRVSNPVSRTSTILRIFKV